ncbi:MAG: hypothetical protein AAB731_02260, partial [Patescibacteria group bacterium]
FQRRKSGKRLQSFFIFSHGYYQKIGKNLFALKSRKTFFNQRFGEYFSDPKPILTATPRLTSITDPTKKMSKSLGPKSYIALRDEPEVIAQKIAGVPTESSGTLPPRESAGKEFAGAYNLLNLLEIFGGKERSLYYINHQPIRYGDLKKEIAAAIAAHFEAFRNKRRGLDDQDALVRRALAVGAKAARIVAVKTMKDVKKRVGLR